MPVSSVDRFIPARELTNLENASYNISHGGVDSISDVSINCDSKQLFVNTAKYANNIINYRKLLGSALGLTQSHVLKCSISKSRPEFNEISATKYSWPVTPRRKPLLSSPEFVLDMPDIDTTIHHHVIDWGKQGQIATIFHGEVHIWVSSSSPLACTNTNKTVQKCVRWNRQGTKFAVARSYSYMSIIDAETLKIIRNVLIKCLDCTITAIEWSKNETVVGGCTCGSLVCEQKNNYPRTSHFYTFFKDEIIDLKFSCNDNYLLASTIGGTTAILKWPITLDSMLQVFSADDNDLAIRSTSWHPWKECILAVGEINSGITIWNVNNQKSVDYEITKPYFKDKCFLDCLTFNPLSAELLVSFYCTEFINEEECNFITVFSDLHTRVDEMQCHIGRVPHLLWDGTGTKLATVGADENLVIWNFFGKGTIEKKMLKQNKKKSKYNIFEISKRLHTCIR